MPEWTCDKCHTKFSSKCVWHRSIFIPGSTVEDKLVRASTAVYWKKKPQLKIIREAVIRIECVDYDDLYFKLGLLAKSQRELEQLGCNHEYILEVEDDCDLQCGREGPTHTRRRDLSPNRKPSHRDTSPPRKKDREQELRNIANAFVPVDPSQDPSGWGE
jgi:hypothetical protein